MNEETKRVDASSWFWKVDSGNLTSQLAKVAYRMFEAGVSDINIQSDDFVFAYLNRAWVQASDKRLDHSQVTHLVRNLRDEAGLALLAAGAQVDGEAVFQPFADKDQDDFAPDLMLRCRMNITAARVGTVDAGYAITLRTIPGLPPTLQSLNLPTEILSALHPKMGLVLIVGITGAGKTTLLGAILRERTELPEPSKILTFEDPVELTFARLTRIGSGSARMPEIAQAQIGLHVAKFEDVAPNVLRRKADVIVMGEMRDRLSAQTGLLMAATGHATYATLHCETPAQAVARVVTEFPPEEQASIASKLLDNLRLIIAQKIVRRLDGVAQAYRSWMIFDQKLKRHLREKPLSTWSGIIEDQCEAMGQTFAHQSKRDYQQGLLSLEGFSDVAGLFLGEARAFLKQQGILKPADDCL